MSRISEASIQEVNAQADALAIIGEYVRLEKRGGRYWGLCPFHNEKTASFSVETDRKFFYCFGCGKGGGVVNFVMEMEKLSFPETIELMSKKLGLELVYENGSGPDRIDGIVDQRNRLMELYSRVAGSFSHILTQTATGAFAREYLKSRGVDELTFTRFRVGYSLKQRSWLHQFLLSKGYSDEFLLESGLFSKKHAHLSLFADRLMFPINDRFGKTIAFGARLLRGEGPKYLNSPETVIFKKGENLFALDLAISEIRRTKEAYICEGYMDVMALHIAGITNAVAPLGTAFTEYQARLLLRWAERVRLVFDADEAGKSAAVKGILTCRKVGLACSVVSLAGGKDPADILVSSGAEALQKAAKCFINDFEYLVERAKDVFDISDSGEKARAVRFVFPFLETLDSEVSLDACVGALADAFGVERSSVVADYTKQVSTKRSASPESDALKKAFADRKPLKMNDELYLFTAIVFNRSLYGKLRSILVPEEIDDVYAKELFIALEECYRNEIEGIDGLVARISNVELKSFILVKGASEAFSEQADKIVSDGIARIKSKNLERRRSALIMRLKTFRNEKSEDAALLEELLAEKMHIDAELSRLKDVHE